MKRKLIAIAISLVAASVLPLMAAGATTFKITLGAKPSLMVYGHQATLSGAVSSQKQNEKVALQSKDCTSTNGFSTTSSLLTSPGGTFSYTTTPLFNTTYLALWKNTPSKQVFVRVRPYVSLVKLSRHRYRVRVKAASDLGHHYVAFERVLGVQHYRVLKKLRLLSITRVGSSKQTFVSGRTFRASLKPGLRVRIYMRDSYSGPCYAAGKSRVIHS